MAIENNIDRLETKQRHEFSNIAKSKTGIGKNLKPTIEKRIVVHLHELYRKFGCPSCTENCYHLLFAVSDFGFM